MPARQLIPGRCDVGTMRFLVAAGFQSVIHVHLRQHPVLELLQGNRAVRGHRGRRAIAPADGCPAALQADVAVVLVHRGRVDRCGIKSSLAHADIAAGIACAHRCAGRGKAGHHPVGNTHETALPQLDDGPGDEWHQDNHVADGRLLVGQRGVESIGELERHTGRQLQRARLVAQVHERQVIDDGKQDWPQADPGQRHHVARDDLLCPLGRADNHQHHNNREQAVDDCLDPVAHVGQRLLGQQAQGAVGAVRLSRRLGSAGQGIDLGHPCRIVQQRRQLGAGLLPDVVEHRLLHRVGGVAGVVQNPVVGRAHRRNEHAGSDSITACPRESLLTVERLASRYCVVDLLL